MNSLVFRGIPDKSIFERAITTARTWHDGEIILSTWEGAEKGIDMSLVDKVILTKDPGPLDNFQNESLIHAKRQILAAYKGVKEAKGEKTLLLRTDCIPHKSIFKFIDERDIDETNLFKNKLVCGSMMTINPDYIEFPFHDIIWRVCDWFQCGITEDVYKFTNVLDEFEKYKYTEYGLEQVWLYSCFMKFNKDCVSSKNWWGHLLDNFKIIDNEETAGIINTRWHGHTHPGFITQSIYEEKCKELRG